jgi:microcystin degradation protein MlrC
VPLRIGIGSVVHEASAFVQVPFGLDDLHRHPLYFGQEVIDKAGSLETAIPGFLDLDDPDVELIPLLSSMLPGGAGLMTLDAYEYIRGELLEAVRRAGRLDGCLLSLHGGMMAAGDGLDDADADLLEALRTVLEPHARLGAAVDMHATLTPRLVQAADVLMAYQTFPPHWDKREVGLKVARLLVQAIRGEIEPVSALVNIPMLLQPESEDTRRSPMADVMASGRDAEGIRGILSVSIVVGFPPADVPLAGPSVLVISDDAAPLARDVASGLAERWFAMREAFVVPLASLDDAVERALRATPEARLLLCDQADNPGAGGAGDATALLDALIRGGVPDVAYGVIADPAAVAACFEAGVGAEAALDLGERIRPFRQPLRVVGLVRTLSDGEYRNSGPMWTGVAGRLGRAVLLQIEGLDLIVCERPNGSWDPAVYAALGLDLRTKSVIVSKSQVFGLEGLRGLYSDVVIVDGEGWGTTNYQRLPFRNVTRPIFPLDERVAFDAGRVFVTTSGPAVQRSSVSA